MDSLQKWSELTSFKLKAVRIKYMLKTNGVEYFNADCCFFSLLVLNMSPFNILQNLEVSVIFFALLKTVY